MSHPGKSKKIGYITILLAIIVLIPAVALLINYDKSSVVAETETEVTTEEPKPVFVEDIRLETELIQVIKGKTAEVVAHVVPEDADVKDITYASNNENIVTVDEITGEITAHKTGFARITCTANDGTGVSVNCVVEVIKPVESISLNYNEIQMLRYETFPINVTVEPEDAGNKKVTYKSSDESVALVSDCGIVTAVGVGEAQIICKAADGSGIAKVCMVSVNSAERLYIRRLYEKGLCRELDEAGVIYWSRKIDEGDETYLSVAKTFLCSSAFTKKKVTDDEFVRILYRVFFDREADAAGLEYWIGQIEKGNKRERIIERFCESEEFLKQFPKKRAVSEK